MRAHLSHPTSDGTGYVCLWLSMIMLCCLMVAGDSEAARVVAEKRECATCHIAWMSEFKRDDIATLIPYDPRPVVASGKQDVVSTERMCFSCHDGFTLDSRPIWLEGRHNHPVGMVPSDKVVLPEQDGKTVFPLNDDGKVYCGTCHSAHGLSWQQSESPIFLRVPNVQSSMCMTCHERPADQEQGTNHPVLKVLAEKPERLAALGGKFGRNDEIICQSCHTPHAARSRPLTVVDNRQAGLCSQCHTDKAKLPGTKHDLTIMSPEAENIKGEKVAEFGPCLACHVVHDAGKSAPLWGRDSISDKDPVAGICKSCHNPKGLAKDKTITAHSHPTDVSIEKLGLTPTADGWQSQHPVAGEPLQSLPLYDEAGHRTEDADRVSCPTCHDLHNWSPLGKPEGDPKQLEGDGQNSFLRIAQGENSTLCTNCHVDKRSVLRSKHSLTNRKDRSRLQQSANVKLRLDQGVCGSCHRAHNGLGAVMTPVKRQGKQSQMQSICTTCHVKGGIAGDKLTGKHSHPLQRDLSRVGGRTSLPLFNEAGQRHAGGRVDCATCHNPHQWDPTNALTAAGSNPKVEGDATNSFLRRTAAPDSALCVDCHRYQGPVRGTDHDMRVTGRKATNHQGREVSQTGVCGQCHSVHNAESGPVLWARDIKPGLDPQTALCLSCHTEGAVAADKIPEELMRPHGILVWSNQMRASRSERRLLPYVPVFNSRGQRASVGRLRCASCHNPHVWDAERPKEGKNRNIEGNVTNSFLRNGSSSHIVCTDCHGQDAIFRYKYFHGEPSSSPHSLYK
ncbi:MAG: cytochrome c3 family protein [Chromatiales bacterium]